jgi:zinc protease
MTDYPTTFTEADLALTKESLAQRRARASETSTAKLRILADIGDYGLPTDHQAREDAVIAGMTVDTVRALAKRHVQPDRMHYVLVGDAQSQVTPLKALGLGDPVVAEED